MTMGNTITKKLNNKSFGPIESFWKKKEQEKINSIKLEKENIKKDVDYVKTLEGWDKKFLPKIVN